MTVQGNKNTKCTYSNVSTGPFRGTPPNRSYLFYAPIAVVSECMNPLNKT